MKLVKTDFEVVTLEDELRVDGLCRELLFAFYQDRLDAGMDEHEATLLANSADYFVRDFVIGARMLNILDETPGIVRKFAGNWYIVNTLEPLRAELTGHLNGIREFYHFLRRHEAIDDAFLAQIDKECSDIDYYDLRIDSFWAIEGDGYYEWAEECSLKGQ
jgi:hypothetical protein